MEYKDYYKILGVEKTAGKEELKKRYRKLAREYHPDVNVTDKNAAVKFGEISEAYDVLSDDEKRKKYEALGTEWEGRKNAGQGDGFDWSKYTQPGANSAGEWEDLFGNDPGSSDFFRNIFGKASQGRGGARYAVKGRDYNAELSLNLEEAYKGGIKVLSSRDQKQDGPEIERHGLSGLRKAREPRRPIVKGVPRTAGQTDGAGKETGPGARRHAERKGGGGKKMNTQKTINLRQFCGRLRVEYDLVRDFAEYGLYPAVFAEDEIEIETKNLYILKKVVSLHQDLGINKEGIEVILSLSGQICELQKEVELLRSEMAQLKVHADREEPENLKSIGLLIEISDPFTIPEEPPR